MVILELIVIWPLREIENHGDIFEVIHYFPQKNEFFKPFPFDTEWPHSCPQPQTQADKYANTQIHTCKYVATPPNSDIFSSYVKFQDREFPLPTWNLLLSTQHMWLAK